VKRIWIGSGFNIYMYVFCGCNRIVSSDETPQITCLLCHPGTTGDSYSEDNINVKKSEWYSGNSFPGGKWKYYLRTR